MGKSNTLLSVTINGSPLEVDSGTSIAAMLDLLPNPGDRPAVGAVVDNRMSGLNRIIRHNARISTIDITAREGMEIYRRTAGMLFYAAISEFNPNAKVEIGQSFDEGYYFDTIGFKADAHVVTQLESIMRDLVAQSMPLDPVWTPIEEAIQEFERVGRKDRVLLLRQMRRSEVPILKIGNYTGYVHGPVAPNTALINQFKLHLHAGGLVLEFPDRTGQLVGSIQPRPKLLSAYQERKSWNRIMHVSNVAQLNDMASQGHLSEVIKVAEALHEKKIAAIADTIADRRRVRCVFVAGPSSSGKTTFTKRLAIQLRVCGLNPRLLSLDHYFVNREDSPRDENGDYDFEAPETLDLPYLNKQLSELLDGQLVHTPSFSFQEGRRTEKTYPIQLAEDDILLIEGIHGLNDRLSSSIPAERKFKIYISALTQLCIDDHNRIYTSDSRMIRRMVRDRRYRGISAAETIARWPSVRRGETKHIFPFLEDADAMFDSALCYEQAVLKTYALRFLAEVQQQDPAYVEALRLYRFLDLFVPALHEDVPANSLLSEFIGGSWFDY